jgi:hypothetical protein
VVTADELAAQRGAVARSPDLQALRAHLRERAAPLLARLPHVPLTKALLSVDGGVCPDDGAGLVFDPWSPSAHRCPRCGRMYGGERHDRHWARYQHLWLAERAAHLATLAALDDDPAAAARAGDILGVYASSYWQFPNRDNVLGPSRLFFSTYLESVWICNYLAAATLLRTADRLDPGTAKGVNQVADEAANLIGEFDEAFSNRQIWNNAALTAIAAWFEDEELAQQAIHGPTGLRAHLLRGFGRDGLWYEGENYHLFALRGFMTGAAWARQAGVDVYAEPELATRIRAALLAPARTALPNFTFPARKDSPRGVSLGEPAYLELWELGRVALGSAPEGVDTETLDAWLRALYGAPPPPPRLSESYLHDAPIDPAAAAPPRAPARARLSWWALLGMGSELPADGAAWSPRSVLLESQGLAVLRSGERYVSLECGPSGGGHGHPDRLALTLYADGVPWLADPGTGSYVSRDLSWYRSTLAHNAPRLDGSSQPVGDAVCEAFDAPGEWLWARGRYGELTRAVVVGPAYVLDVLELASRGEHILELAWHFAAAHDPGPDGGRWTPAELADAFVSRVERFVPDAARPLQLELTNGARTVKAFLSFEGELLRAEGPGQAGAGRRETFHVARATGRAARFVTVLEPVGDRGIVRGVRAHGSVIEIETAQGIDRHTATPAGWEISPAGGARVRLAGGRTPEPPFTPLIELNAPTPALAAALRVSEPPLLDGSLGGFDTSEPLRLELEDQYRRSEEPYAGPEEFSGVAYAGWDDDALYLAVEVMKPDLCLRPADAPPLALDNEPDDIHSDGLQLYLFDPQGSAGAGFLVVPETRGSALRVRGAGDAPGAPATVRGAWSRLERGYRVTLAIAWPEWQRAHVGGQVRFDLLVNEMLPGRLRRAGQLVWSGRDGWVWLRGDRQHPEDLGILELVG